MTTFRVDVDEALRRADGFIDITMVMKAPAEVLRFDLARMILDTYAEGRLDGMKSAHAVAMGTLELAAAAAKAKTFAAAAESEAAR